MLNKRKVFISGPIQGMERDQSYRERIGKILLDHGYEPIDLWQREKVIYSVVGKEWRKNFLQAIYRNATTEPDAKPAINFSP